jgi:hypothetical protein
LALLEKVRQSHAPQDVRRLGELDVVVADDLHTIAPGVTEIKKRSWQHLDTDIGQRLADRLWVVHHEPEVPTIVCGLTASFLKREELVA